MAMIIRAAPRVVLLAVTIAGVACDSPRVDAPHMAPSAAPSSAKSSGGPSVMAVNPASGHQGDATLDVTITGSGFDSGSKASWQLNGVTYSKITVNSTRFNSSTSLTANITIAADAEVTTYDIAVLTSTGKKGIGAELFTVTYAVPLSGVSEGMAISDDGAVAGYRGTISGFFGTDVVVSSPGAPAVLVAANSVVWDMDRTGHVIGGGDAAGKPVIWTSATRAAGSWVATSLPDHGSGGHVRGMATDNAGNVVFMGGGVTTGANRVPAVWSKVGGTWQLRDDQLPIGSTKVFIQGINVRGQAVGMDGSSCCFAFYWDSLGAATILAPAPGAAQAAAWGISDDGTVAVGYSGGLAVLWRRTLTNDVYSPWSAAIPLENSASLCTKGGSAAYDVNAAGTVIVGSSCGVAVVWKVSGGVVTSRVLLQGLGPPNQSVAYGVSDTPAPLAAGLAKSSTGVYWWGF